MSDEWRRPAPATMLGHGEGVTWPASVTWTTEPSQEPKYGSAEWRSAVRATYAKAHALIDDALARHDSR